MNVVLNDYAVSWREAELAHTLSTLSEAFFAPLPVTKVLERSEPVRGQPVTSRPVELFKSGMFFGGQHPVSITESLKPEQKTCSELLLKYEVWLLMDVA